VINDTLSGSFFSHKGTPQGSTLSLILFDIYLKDITKHLHPKSKILLYADDIVIYFTNKDPLKAYKSVQASLDRTATYLWQCGLELSPKKSNWLVFTRGRNLPSLDSLKIFGNPVPRMDVGSWELFWKRICQVKATFGILFARALSCWTYLPY